MCKVRGSVKLEEVNGEIKETIRLKKYIQKIEWKKKKNKKLPWEWYTLKSNEWASLTFSIEGCYI